MVNKLTGVGWRFQLRKTQRKPKSPNLRSNKQIKVFADPTNIVDPLLTVQAVNR